MGASAASVAINERVDVPHLDDRVYMCPGQQDGIERHSESNGRQMVPVGDLIRTSVES
jgi:hypothetical protein